MLVFSHNLCIYTWPCHIHYFQGFPSECVNSATGNPQAKAPKRVILFTTIMMLGLLSKCRWGSVDGTFKSSSKQWKQLFVMLCEYEGSWLPMAFGWLPDKYFASYQIFLILLMEAFRSHSSQITAIYGRSKLKLKKVKMDFEINIIRAFDFLFVIRGCLFHFSQAGNILKRVKIQKCKKLFYFRLEKGCEVERLL